MLPHILHNLSFVERLYALPQIDSTNTYARNLKQVPHEGKMFVIRADKQLQGRGRGDNSFFSEHDGGLWISIVCTLSNLSNHFHYNRALSLAICTTIKEIDPNIQVSIKWPNDIYCGRKKIAGILLENHPEFPSTIILGFGFNIAIAEEHFPVEIRNIATSLQIESGKQIKPELLLKPILWYFNYFLNQSSQEAHKEYIKFLYRSGAAIVIQDQKGILDGVNEDGTLRLHDGTTIHSIASGTLRFVDDVL